MNGITKVRNTLVDISGIIIMVIVLFYLNYYELNPIDEPKSN